MAKQIDEEIRTEGSGESGEPKRKLLFDRTKGLTAKKLTYCPGCTHGVIHRIMAELLEEMNLLDKAIGVSPVGCSVFCYDNFNLDMVGASHGRAPAVATGIRRVHPKAFVFTYQGDGDLAAIGTTEIIHAANRGEKITTVFVNNAIYGMTGGQMAPTTLVKMVTTTTPRGRNVENEGGPIRIAELLSNLDGTAFSARVAIYDSASILKAKKILRQAFQTQIKGLGFSIVEILSNCNVGWKMTPREANEWVRDEMTKFFPLGVFKDISKGASDAKAGEISGGAEK